MMEIFKTDGKWRIPGGGLVTDWSKRPEYVYQENDVPFYFGPHYNYGNLDGMDAFVRDNKIVEVIEIIEVFREPYTDVDSSFRGRGLLVARFANELDAMMFKMTVPHPEPVGFRDHISRWAHR